VLCARCHTASAAKPKGFPQVEPAEHSQGLPCETATTRTVRDGRAGDGWQEVRNEHFQTQNVDSVAGSGGRMGIRAGRYTGGLTHYKMSDHWWGMLIDISSA